MNQGESYWAGQEPWSEIDEFFEHFSNGGLFPSVAYCLLTGATPSLVMATASMNDVPLALTMLRRMSDRQPHAGTSIPLTVLERLDATGVVRLWELKLRSSIPPQFLWRLGRVASGHMAQQWHARGIAVVDISGFSLMPNDLQLSSRLSLGHALNQSIRRFHKALGRTPPFSRVSTGDGYYFWSDPGAAGDRGCLAVLVLLATQMRALSAHSGLNIRIRSAFTIADMYMLPYDGLGRRRDDPSDLPRLDVVGPGPNQLNRLVSGSAPGQILIGDFRSRRFSDDDDDGGLSDDGWINETPQILVDGALDLIGREEGQESARLSLESALRVQDKHLQWHRAHNLVGFVANRIGDTNERIPVGVRHDDAAVLIPESFRDDFDDLA